MSLFTGNTGLLKALCCVCIFTFLAGDAAFALAPGGEVLTNFQVIEKISNDAAQEIVAGVQAKAPTGLILVAKIKGAGDADFIFDDALVTQLRNAGLRVTAAKPSVAVPQNTGAPPNAGVSPAAAVADSVAYELSYRIIRLSLAYSRIWRHHWFGSKTVDRLARVTIRAQVLERRTGSVLAVVDSQRQYADSIPYALLGTVEEKQYEFTRPAREEFKMTRIVEPLIVAGIVTGLVFLFFSNQSNK